MFVKDNDKARIYIASEVLPVWTEGEKSVEKVAQPELPKVIAWQKACGLVILTEVKGLEKQEKRGDRVYSINQRPIAIQMDTHVSSRDEFNFLTMCSKIKVKVVCLVEWNCEMGFSLAGLWLTLLNPEI